MHANYAILRRFTFILAAFASLLLTGCATSQPAYLADSSPAQRIECNGVFGSWDSCRAQAIIACGDSGYQVIGRNRVDGLSETEADQRSAAGSFHERNMLVQCDIATVRFAALATPAADSAEL